jgi:hypothetical protein
MPAKQSQEMRDALMLVANGATPRQAADLSANAVWFTSIYSTLKREKEKAKDPAMSNTEAAQRILSRVGQDWKKVNA